MVPASGQGRDSAVANVKLYTIQQAAELLGVPVNGVYKMVARGELPSVKLGRRVRIPHCDLQVFIDALRNIE